MKGTLLDWASLQKQDPKQTAAIVDYDVKRKDGSRNLRTRVLIKGWMSREEAWLWCKENDIKRKTIYSKEGKTVEMQVKLLRLSKVIKDLAARKPKGTSAILVA